MSDGDQLIQAAESWAAIVPELVVSDLARSADVYTNLYGFALVLFEPGRRAVVAMEACQLVLKQFKQDAPGAADLAMPFGRGLVIHVRTADPKPIYEVLRRDKQPIVVPMETAELSAGGVTITQTSFVAADPDGYQLRISD